VVVSSSPAGGVAEVAGLGISDQTIYKRRRRDRIEPGVVWGDDPSSLTDREPAGVECQANEQQYSE
jgi:hypothetical protein